MIPRNPIEKPHMEMRHRYREAHTVMAKANRLLAICHRRPDGDTLGAAAACLLWCARRGVEANAFCVDPFPPTYAFLPQADRFTADPAVFRRPWDAVVVFDAGDLKHAGAAELLAAMKPRPPVVAIDHHFTNERYADVNVVSPFASSASELMHGFFQENGIPLDAELATCLLTGIVNDTDSLTNPAASRPAFGAAAQLLARGADWRVVSDTFVRNRSISALRLMGRAMARLKHDPETGIASTVVFVEDCQDGTSESQIDGLANFLGNTLDVEVILVLKEKPDGLVSGSFRTTGETDVSALAKELGGGGHRKASGFTVAGRIVEQPHGWTVVRSAGVDAAVGCGTGAAAAVQAAK